MVQGGLLLLDVTCYRVSLFQCVGISVLSYLKDLSIAFVTLERVRAKHLCSFTPVCYLIRTSMNALPGLYQEQHLIVVIV